MELLKTLELILVREDDQYNDEPFQVPDELRSFPVLENLWISNNNDDIYQTPNLPYFLVNMLARAITGCITLRQVCIAELIDISEESLRQLMLAIETADVEDLSLWDEYDVDFLPSHASSSEILIRIIRHNKVKSLDIRCIRPTPAFFSTLIPAVIASESLHDFYFYGLEDEEWTRILRSNKSLKRVHSPVLNFREERTAWLRAVINHPTLEEVHETKLGERFAEAEIRLPRCLQNESTTNSEILEHFRCRRRTRAIAHRWAKELAWFPVIASGATSFDRSSHKRLCRVRHRLSPREYAVKWYERCVQKLLLLPLLVKLVTAEEPTVLPTVKSETTDESTATTKGIVDNPQDVGSMEQIVLSSIRQFADIPGDVRAANEMFSLSSFLVGNAESDELCWEELVVAVAQGSWDDEWT